MILEKKESEWVTREEEELNVWCQLSAALPLWKQNGNAAAAGGWKWVSTCDSGHSCQSNSTCVPEEYGKPASVVPESLREGNLTEQQCDGWTRLSAARCSSGNTCRWETQNIPPSLQLLCSFLEGVIVCQVLLPAGDVGGNYSVG